MESSSSLDKERDHFSPPSDCYTNVRHGLPILLETVVVFVQYEQFCAQN